LEQGGNDKFLLRAFSSILRFCANPFFLLLRCVRWWIVKWVHTKAQRRRKARRDCNLQPSAHDSFMMQPIAWFVLAAIHATPALAFFRPSLIKQLYRVDPASPLFLLFQHRAALFLVIVVISIWAAFDPGSRRMASVAVAISMVSFVMLWLIAGQPAALRTIASVDLIGLPVLAFAMWTAFRPA
jgi:hypothetical protein